MVAGMELSSYLTKHVRVFGCVCVWGGGVCVYVHVCGCACLCVREDVGVLRMTDPMMPNTGEKQSERHTTQGAIGARHGLGVCRGLLRGNRGAYDCSLVHPRRDEQRGQPHAKSHEVEVILHTTRCGSHHDAHLTQGMHAQIPAQPRDACANAATVHGRYSDEHTG